MQHQFTEVFNYLKFRALDIAARPFIFALTALVNEEVTAQCKATGFDECLSAPLSVMAFEKVVVDGLMTAQIEQVICEHSSFDTLTEMKQFMEL